MMGNRLRRSSGTRAAGWPTMGLVLVMSLILAAGLALAACGGSSSESEGAPTTVGEAVSSTVSSTDTTTGGTGGASGDTGAMSPSELGDAIAATWAEAIQELVTLLEDKPEVDAARAQVEQLKENYVTKLVEFGRQRETLDAGEVAQVSVRTAAGLEKAGGEPWFASYLSIYENYQAGDQEFANLLASFNILTQYADFDLLKQQAPDEATRLGVN